MPCPLVAFVRLVRVATLLLRPGTTTTTARLLASVSGSTCFRLRNDVRHCACSYRIIAFLGKRGWQRSQSGRQAGTGALNQKNWSASSVRLALLLHHASIRSRHPPTPVLSLAVGSLPWSRLRTGVFGLPMLKFSSYHIECLNLRSPAMQWQ